MSKPEIIVRPGFDIIPPKKSRSPKTLTPKAIKNDTLVKFHVSKVLLYK